MHWNDPLRTTATMKIGLAVILLLGGCSPGHESPVATNLSSTIGHDADCGLPTLGWRRLTFDPPIRVAVWRVRLAGSEIDLNGVRVSHAAAMKTFRDGNDLRPSAYAIIEFNRQKNCPALRDLAQTIAGQFDCRTNYCFYSAR